MKKVLVFCVLLALWLSLDGSGAWAIDVGWMQKGVRVWYFGAAGTGMSSDAEEAYLFTSISGNTAQLAHHSGINHWSMPTAETVTGSIIDKGPFWIHPQVLQNIAVGNNWMGIEIKSMNKVTYTYNTFKQNDEFDSLPYLLLPIKALFDLQNQREVVKLVYGNPLSPDFDPVWGTAFFDAETGLCLFNLRLTASNTVFFILSEINYNFATHRAFAEDNGPHTGFKSNIVKTSSAANIVMIQSSVETRYGNTVQMWVSTSAGGSINIYAPPNENYCFFGSVPVLRHKLMSTTPNYPPENWNEYGDYLWWWVPQEALQSSSINIFNIPMTRTSTAPYTFTGSGGTGLYFSNIIFDIDGYMTDFSARHSAIGLVIDLGPSASPGVPIHLVDGLAYYKNTMGRAVPVETEIVDFVTEYYNDILDRAPEPGGAEGWTDEIERIVSLGIDIKEGFIAVGKAFFNSNEYLLMNKLAVDYVEDLYETFLQRLPGQGEIDYHLDYMAQGVSRNEVLNNFIFSPEFKAYVEGIFGEGTVRPENILVNDFYRGILSRLPDSAGFNYWLGQMRAAQCSGSAQQVRILSHQIALGFIQSDEYIAMDRTDGQYVEDLYDAVLRRAAAPGEINYWLNELNTKTWEQVLQGFTDSNEFQIRVQEVIDAGCLP